MDSSSSRSPGVPVLHDPWARGPGIPLNGPLERTSMDRATVSFVTGLLALGAAFIVFQFILSPIVLIVQIAMAEGGFSMEALGSPEQLMASYTRELVVSNSVGQVLGLAVPALMAARLHTTELFEYLRLRRVNWQVAALALVGVLGMQPITQWLAELNQHIPVPDDMRMLEQSQLELIRSVLESDMGLMFNLAMLALVPGICEELLFRGYAQRQFERSGGATVGILLSGALFGFYHLRPSQVIPLVVLGLFMAYLVWRTGSLLPAILVHIAHNGIAVFSARYVESHPEYDLQSLEQVSIPWYMIALGFVILGSVLYFVHTSEVDREDA